MSEKIVKTPSKALPTMLPTQENCVSPRGRGALEDKKDSDEYPFKRDLEDLLCSPKEIFLVVDCLEEGEIEGSHSLPDSSTTQNGVS